MGNFISICYMMAFQIMGIVLMCIWLRKEKLSKAFKVLIGSVVGTLTMQWFPVIFAFVFDFTMTAHVLSIILMAVCTILSVNFQRNKKVSSVPFFTSKKEIRRFIKENPCIWLMIVLFVFFAYCVHTHTILPWENGSLHTGQATYGDMNMHLAFITSIAEQGTFLPEYSIFPGAKLSYPFLCDSISSSMYLLGGSLRFSYIFPMLIASMQVFAGFYCFIKYWFWNGKAALIAWFIFFTNGGLGFIYFTNIESIKRNFSDFYFTPTSLRDHNIHIPQLTVNMLLPQRSTLFGWAVLFSLLTLFLYTVRSKKKNCFVICAIIASALPMIHTHSFLSFGLICVMWLFYELKDMVKIKETKEWLLRMAVPIGLLLFTVLQIINNKTELLTKEGIKFLLVGIGIIIVLMIVRMQKIVKQKNWKSMLSTWGLFLAIIMGLALPQLFVWTFDQASGEGFIRSSFIWDNNGDQYIWFYLKNFGIPFLLLIPAYLLEKKKHLKVASPFLLLWFVADLVVLQPNTYDNNKLLFIGFVFICGLVSNFIVKVYEKKWSVVGKIAVAIIVTFFVSVSGIMTMGREYVSDYELYSADLVQACEYIEENTEEDGVFLTGTNHNNAVAALTGRSIVCGSGTFLYFHGIDYQERESQLNQMYESPIENKKLFDEYKVSYVLIGPHEILQFPNINETEFHEIGSLIYNRNGVKIFSI